MQWPVPTTKQQMYEVMQDIFYYYRIRREAWDDLDLLPLQLDRLEFTPLSDEALLEKARLKVLPDNDKEEFFALKELNDESLSIQTKKLKLLQDKQTAVAKVETEFDQSEQEIYKQVANRGMANSTVIVDKINDLKNKRVERISQVVNTYDAQIADLDGKLTGINAQIESTKEFFANLLEKRATAKFGELKEEQEKTIREVFKYNEGLDEKEQKYSNDLIRQKANLELKFLELNSAFFSKDQLVEMGYYKAVIKCATDYFDTLDTLTAYQEISTDKTVMIYLDDYYNIVVTNYQNRCREIA